MLGIRRVALPIRVGPGAAGLASFVALIWIGSGSSHTWSAPPAAADVPTLGDGVVSGAFVAAAVCAAAVAWRTRAGRTTGWTVATGALVAGQALLVTLVALHYQPLHHAAVEWLLLGIAVAGLATVVGQLAGSRRARHVVDETFVVGVGMGLVAAGHLILELPRAHPPTPVMVALTGVLLGTHVLVAAIVVRQSEASRAMSALIVLTVVLVGLSQCVQPLGLAGTYVDSTLWIARTAVGAAWLAVAWAGLHRILEEDRRRIRSVERVLVDATREQRELLHEMRSAVAGLVSGSTLLDRDDLPPDVRVRLWTAVRRELGHVERLLSHESAGATDFSLDDALDAILDVQRLKGRKVELRSSGGLVRARFDALAEVVNIIMDNAATHGGTDSTVVEVVRRDEETVDITVTDFGRGIPQDERTHIFEWGGRSGSSPGEGIGLHMAKRLMTEDGGSLSLAEVEGPGSSFVISLPAVRRSPENDLTTEDVHAWRRSG